MAGKKSNSKTKSAKPTQSKEIKSVSSPASSNAKPEIRYISLLKIPAILLVIVSLLGYVLDLSSPSTQIINTNNSSQSGAGYPGSLFDPRNIVIFLLKIGIVAYAGFTIIKHEGTLLTAAKAGALLGALESIVALLLSILNILISPVLQQSLAGADIWSIAMLVLIFFIIGGIVNILMDALIAVAAAAIVRMNH